MICILPPMPRYKPGASAQERFDMYKQYVGSLVLYNPHHYLPRGVKKRWYHFGLNEHPFNDLEDMRRRLGLA